jgi:AcrR family transcriptional regulator
MFLYPNIVQLQFDFALVNLTVSSLFLNTVQLCCTTESRHDGDSKAAEAGSPVTIEEMKSEAAMPRTSKMSAVKENARARRDTTAEQIVRVTLRRIRRGGFASVSMRQIADELGITATALYHHFRDKDALLDRVAELIYDSIPTPARELHWTERIRQLVLAQQRAHLDHPGLARFVLMRRSESTGAFTWIESILEILHEGGLGEEDILLGLNQLSFLINPMTFLDAPQRKPGARAFSSEIARRRIFEHPERFPVLASMVDRMPGRPYEELFVVALDGIIAGLLAHVDGTGNR